MKSALGFLILLLITAYFGGAWFFSDVLINFDTYSLAEDKERLNVVDVAQFGLPKPENFTVDVNGVTLAGWYFDNEAECGVMILHGHSSTRYGALDYAPLFWDRGCDLLMFDARGHGASSDTFGTYGFYESRDAQAVLEFFVQRSGLAKSHIGLMGESYGGATALLTASLEPELAFVAADSAYTSLKRIVREQAVAQYGQIVTLFVPMAFLLSEARAHFEVDEVSPTDAIARVNVPIFLQHSLQDAYTVPAHSQDLFAVADSNNIVLHLSDWNAAHAQAINRDFEAYKRFIDTFLAEYVPQFPQAKEVN